MDATERECSPDMFPDWVDNCSTSCLPIREPAASFPLPDPRGFPAPNERVFNPLRAWCKSRWGPPPPPSKQRRITRQFIEEMLTNCRTLVVRGASNAAPRDDASSSEQEQDAEPPTPSGTSTANPAPIPRRAGADPALFYKRHQPATMTSRNAQLRKPRRQRRNRTWTTRLRRRQDNER